MKKILFTICSFILVSNSYGVEINETRETIGTELNSTVKGMKKIFSDVETELNNTKTNAEVIHQQAKDLVDRSKTAELNPSVLNHGNENVPSCNYATENLSWDGSSWVCTKMEVDSECQAAAPDEYRYKDSSGNYVCSKSSKGQGLKYYWTFRGYSSTCSNASVGYNKLYDCNYKNKSNQVVQVSNSNCKSAKPSVGKKTCTASWRVGSWGSCNRSCGGGTQYRAVTCPSGYSCPSSKPTTSKSCNTNACVSYSWRVSCSYTHCGANCSGSAANCCSQSTTKRCLASPGGYVSNGYCSSQRVPSCTPTNNPRRSSSSGSCSSANGCGRGTASGRVN